MGGGVCGGDVDCQRYSMDAPPPRPTAAAWQDIFRRPVHPPSPLSGGRAATGSATFRWLPWPVHSRLYSCHHGRGPGGNGICLLAPEGPRGFAPGCRAVIRNSRPLAGSTISYQKCFSRRMLFESRGSLSSKNCIVYAHSSRATGLTTVHSPAGAPVPLPRPQRTRETEQQVQEHTYQVVLAHSNSVPEFLWTQTGTTHADRGDRRCRACRAPGDGPSPVNQRCVYTSEQLA